MLDIHSDNLYEVEVILDHGWKNDEFKYLASWKDYPSEEDSWEPRENFIDESMLQEYDNYHELGRKVSRRNFEVGQRRTTSSQIIPEV
ncbi:hypothetical protein B7463_g3039, partial [Scytalidium lignicola]